MNVFIEYIKQLGLNPKVISRDEMLAHGHTAIITASAKALGSIKSDKKARSSRTNGKLGGKPAYTPEFELFWQCYPRHTAKQEAFTAYRKVADEHIEIMKGLQNIKDSWKDVRYTPHASTFLNGRRWEDEVGVVEEIAFIDLTK